MLLKWMIHRKLSAFEREHGYDASYMHEVVDRDVGAFLKFGRATGLGSYRKDVPAEVYFAAGLTESIQADCGPCTQLGVGLRAAERGCRQETLAAVVEEGTRRRCHQEVALGVRFARAVLARDAAADGCREAILEVGAARADRARVRLGRAALSGPEIRARSRQGLPAGRRRRPSTSSLRRGAEAA